MRHEQAARPDASAQRIMHISALKANEFTADANACFEQRTVAATGATPFKRLTMRNKSMLGEAIDDLNDEMAWIYIACVTARVHRRVRRSAPVSMLARAV